MSIAAPPKSSSSTTHFCYEKGFFYKIRCGVGNSKLVFIQGHPKTVFSEISVWRGKNCLEFSIAWGRLKISRWLFHSCTIFKAYLIKSLRLSQDGFLVISFTFSIRFCFSFLFLRLNLQQAKNKKMYSSKGIISLWSELSFFFAIQT